MFDLIVIGGGHAGCEAAYAGLRAKLRVALITLDSARIGVLSCNPAMGGVAKGQIIKEIDAFGGLMGIITDRSTIQFRMLNSSKGPAVRSPRAQCDKDVYPREMQAFLRSHDLEIISGEAKRLEVQHTDAGMRAIRGVELSSGAFISGKTVVITSGTFMQGVMHTGAEQSLGGRNGDASAQYLSGNLKELGFRLHRLKTGTPPRLSKTSIDWSKTEEQLGDVSYKPFSFRHRMAGWSKPLLEQMNCYITYTNQATHEIIAQNFDRSPMFTGVIKGTGPRYCPSIEDKIKRFADKERHQIFLEPEGHNSEEIYVNGMSTSLPKDVQDAFVRSVPGLERAVFIKYGYAVEYDAIDAQQLHATMESQEIDGLFFAGQVNGTSGYEEAGAQGLVAGVNAVAKVKGQAPWIPSRQSSYIGVLVDDLTSRGSDEPYRMFTSRAERRLYLREDNADDRLSQEAYKRGLLSDAEWEFIRQDREQRNHARTLIEDLFLVPRQALVQDFLKARAENVTLKDRVSLGQLLKRPEVSLDDAVSLIRSLVDARDEMGSGLEKYISFVTSMDAMTTEQRIRVEVEIKYDGYLKRDEELFAGAERADLMAIPENLDFSRIGGLSNEVKEKLVTSKPKTLGQLGRLQGITPAAVASVMIYLKKSGNRTVGSKLG